MDMAPAIKAAIEVVKISRSLSPEAVTPTIKLDVEMIPSFAPRTAALKKPAL